MAQQLPSHTPAKHPRQPAGVPASSQQYLDVAQIRDGVVVLKDGSLRAVVLVNAVNFALKSEEEQNALIYSYQGFLNSFNFPIQVVMQSRQLDLAHYLKKLSDQLAETTNELVQLQISDYIQFIERLIQIANIMDKKFYVVVPFSPPSVRQRGWFDKLFNPGNRLEVRMSPAEFKAYRQELLERARIIMGGLSGMGLRSALLGTQEVIELLYATYNPEEATKERLSDVSAITGAYIHPAASGSSTLQVPSSKEVPNSNDQAQPTQQPAANPLASVAPEVGGEPQAVGSAPVADAPASEMEEPAKPSSLAPSAAPPQDNPAPTATEPTPVQQSTGAIALPEPLGPTAAPPATSPEAGRATPVTTGLGTQEPTAPPAAPNAEPQPLGSNPSTVPMPPTPTAGFGQPLTGGTVPAGSPSPAPQPPPPIQGGTQ